jgi:hypothetical protein
MTTIELIGDYKDVLFYLFIIGFGYFLWNLHGYFDHKYKEKQKRETTRNFRNLNNHQS